ncbi:tonsoku-like protein [Bufo gargarizans]|uniref:tonsoku-like protein n=1 Tax=Bufo gargarizans TaxID=30331 RepID=UPI001CF595DB|nr:tonsoku-like protein [Bufo gargarizans]
MADREIKQLEKVKCRARRADNLREEAATCNQLGELLARGGRFREAIEEHRQELGLCEALGDIIGCAVANRRIGECFAETGNYQAALKHQRIHLDLARSVSSDIEEQRALATIGRTYLYMCEVGDVDARRPAEESFLKSLEIVDEKLEGKVSSRDLSEMRARLFLNLGFLYDIMAQADKCSFYIRKSIFIAEQTQLHEDLYRANSNLASIHLRNGEHSKAIRCWEAARECARRMRDKCMESECYCSIGQTLLSLGDFSAGKRSLKKAFLLGSLQESDRDAVRRSLKHAIKGCQLEEVLSELTDGDQQGALSLYEQLGDLYCKVGCYRKAVEYYKLQLRCAESLSRPDRELAVIHVSLAATFSDLKDYPQALEHYRVELGLRKGNPCEECKTWLNMALAVEEDGQGYSQVQQCLTSAMKCAQEAGDPRLQRKVLRQLLAVQQKWGAPEAGDTEAELRDVCGSDGGDSSEEEEAESSEPLQESEVELSSSGDEDLEGYEKSVPSRRATIRWNRRNEKGETPLHRACIEGNAKVVQCLLEKGHPVNPRDYCGWTPLHEACNHGHHDIVQLLLDRGAHINDPGGPLCEGITPLHDALSSGNFHVAQLLIRRGASVTQKTTKGKPPLGSLQEWIHMYGKHLDAVTRRDCKETEKMLRDALEGSAVSSTPQPAPELQDSELFDAEGSEPLLASPSFPSRKQRENSVPRISRTGTEHGTPRNLRLSTQEDEDFPLQCSTQVSEEDPLMEEEPEQLLTPLKPVKKRPRLGAPRPSSDSDIAVERTSGSDPPRLSEGGKEAYQKAMQGLGSAKSRLLSQSMAQTEPAPEEPAPTDALVPSDHYIGDDWLEDDFMVEARSRKRSRWSPGRLEMEEIEYSEEEEEAPRQREKPAPRNVSRKRSRQTKLTQIVDRAVVGRTKSSGQSISIPRIVDGTGAHNTDRGGSAPPAAAQPPAVTVNVSLPPPIRVRVRVQDNVFLIPIPHSGGETHKVSWLAEQASQRYYQSCGLLPRLTLKKEGALLAPEDPILHVLQSNEEVVAEVHSWDLPPLTDRYKKACQSLAVEENRLVRKALEQQETSSVSLCGLSLSGRHLCPVIRALKLQSSLRQLHLSGNLLGDAEVEELLSMLGTLPNLTHLNLSCNRLTHEGLRKLVPAAATSDYKALENLEELDLSMNPLGDGLSQPLAALLLHCPLLSTLHLRACQLSAKFLQQYRLVLADAFRGAVHLKNLSLSHNPLGSTGVELVLKTIPHETISCLELRAVTAGDALITEPLIRYLTQDGCILSHLTLSSNHLSDESVRELARCLPVCSSLTSLDLSGNPKIGGNGFQHLLNAIQERNIEMQELNLTGCSIQGPFNSCSLDALSSLLHELRLCSRSLSKKDREMLLQAWCGESLIVSQQSKLFIKRLT